MVSNNWRVPSIFSFHLIFWALERRDQSAFWVSHVKIGSKLKYLVKSLNLAGNSITWRLQKWAGPQIQAPSCVPEKMIRKSGAKLGFFFLEGKVLSASPETYSWSTEGCPWQRMEGWTIFNSPILCGHSSAGAIPSNSGGLVQPQQSKQANNWNKMNPS